MSVETDITLDNVRLFCEIEESEKEYTDTLVSPAIDAKNWPKTMESLEEYLRGNIGVKWVPLSYVVRSEEALAPSLDEPETSFLSAEDETVAHAPILEGGPRTLTFNIDTMKVWGVIYAIMRDIYSWNYFKSSQRTRYGRKS